MSPFSPKHRLKKRTHPNWPVRLIVVGCLLSFFVSSILLPAISFRNNEAAYQDNRWEYFAEVSLSNTMNWFVVLWTFFFGACLGSFLNVVAYRVPNGLTLLGSSRCPFCFVPIQSQHNVPIIGWFLLRGRCAACRLPIAPRYFIVEIIAGLLLVWLFRFELYSDGQNLPTDRSFEITRFFRVLSAGDYRELLHLNWGLIRIFFVHCLIAYAILTAALMKWDVFQIPRIWAGVHLLLVAMALFIWPTDFEFAGLFVDGLNVKNNFVHRFEVPAIGGGTGIVFGLFFSGLSRERRPGLVFGFTLAGICLGFFGTISLATIFLWIAGLTLLRSRNVASADPKMDPRNLLFALLAAFLIQIGFWRIFDQNALWPSHSSSIWVSIGYLFFIVTMTSLLIPKWKSALDDSNGAGEEMESGETRETDVLPPAHQKPLEMMANSEKGMADSEN